MKKKFENITVFTERRLYDQAMVYVDDLINEATANGALDEQGANNEYTREIGRVGNMCADYESTYMTFNHLKFKSQLEMTLA